MPSELIGFSEGSMLCKKLNLLRAAGYELDVYLYLNRYVFKKDDSKASPASPCSEGKTQGHTSMRNVVN